MPKILFRWPVDETHAKATYRCLLWITAALGLLYNCTHWILAQPSTGGPRNDIVHLTSTLALPPSKKSHRCIFSHLNLLFFTTPLQMRFTVQWSEAKLLFVRSNRIRSFFLLRFESKKKKKKKIKLIKTAKVNSNQKLIHQKRIKNVFSSVESK